MKLSGLLFWTSLYNKLFMFIFGIGLLV